jgi:hypothetical protein
MAAAARAAAELAALELAGTHVGPRWRAGYRVRRVVVVRGGDSRGERAFFGHGRPHLCAVALVRATFAEAL